MKTNLHKASHGLLVSFFHGFLASAMMAGFDADAGADEDEAERGASRDRPIVVAKSRVDLRLSLH